MNSNEDANRLPRLDPGEGILPRKRMQTLKMDAFVYQEATNLLPPDPPQPQDPPQAPEENVIAPGMFAMHHMGAGTPKKPQANFNLAPRTNVPKDLESKELAPRTKDSVPEDFPAETRLC